MGEVHAEEDTKLLERTTTKSDLPIDEEFAVRRDQIGEHNHGSSFSPPLCRESRMRSEQKMSCMLERPYTYAIACCLLLPHDYWWD
ncbi:hypothetical protein N7451_012364 [Penicillium sp. IBT 35674x]|nr:hypothetical protein N7451_012364 [Penicillium sp. IBT 35674x]